MRVRKKYCSRWTLNLWDLCLLRGAWLFNPNERERERERIKPRCKGDSAEKSPLLFWSLPAPFTAQITTHQPVASKIEKEKETKGGIGAIKCIFLPGVREREKREIRDTVGICISTTHKKEYTIWWWRFPFVVRKVMQPINNIGGLISLSLSCLEKEEEEKAFLRWWIPRRKMRRKREREKRFSPALFT